MEHIPPQRTLATTGPWCALIPATTASFLCDNGLLSRTAGLSFDLSSITTLGRDVRIGFEGRNPILLSGDGRICTRSQLGRILIASSIERLDRLLVRFFTHETDPGALQSLEEDLRAIDAQAYASFWSDHCRIFANRRPTLSIPQRIDAARFACDEGRWWDAIDHFSDVLLTDPHLVEAYLGRATAWSEVGEHDRANNDIEAARVLSSEIGEMP